MKVYVVLDRQPAMVGDTTAAVIAGLGVNPADAREVVTVDIPNGTPHEDFMAAVQTALAERGYPTNGLWRIVASNYD